MSVAAQEARQAFGNADLYVEKLLPLHAGIEVQVVGDGTGDVCHLWERDYRYSAAIRRDRDRARPDAGAGLRDRILMAAVKLARHVRFAGLGTFEFLAVRGDEFWFMEANPRLQVEHTITEEITGVDLVQTQIRIALGARLADVRLTSPPPMEGLPFRHGEFGILAAGRHPVPRAGRSTVLMRRRLVRTCRWLRLCAGYTTSLRLIPAREGDRTWSLL